MESMSLGALLHLSHLPGARVGASLPCLPAALPGGNLSFVTPARDVIGTRSTQLSPSRACLQRVPDEDNPNNAWKTKCSR